MCGGLNNKLSIMTNICVFLFMCELDSDNKQLLIDIRLKIFEMWKLLHTTGSDSVRKCTDSIVLIIILLDNAQCGVFTQGYLSFLEDSQSRSQRNAEFLKALFAQIRKFDHADSLSLE